MPNPQFATPLVDEVAAIIREAAHYDDDVDVTPFADRILAALRPVEADDAGLIKRLGLHQSWRDSHGELNDAPNEARARLASLFAAKVQAEKEVERLREAMEYIVRQTGKNANGLIDWQRCVDRIQEVARAALSPRMKEAGDA